MATASTGPVPTVGDAARTTHDPAQASHWSTGSQVSAPEVPDVAVLDQEVVSRARLLLRLARLGSQVVEAHRHPEIRVRLGPARLVERVVGGVELADVDEGLIVLETGLRVDDLPVIVVLASAESEAVESGGGDRQQKGLTSRAEGRDEDIPHGAIGPGVDFVTQRGVRVEAVFRLRVARQRREIRIAVDEAILEALDLAA